MCTKSTLEKLLKETENELTMLFGTKLNKIVLYGSYARGDYDAESDIDVMAMIDMKKDELYKYRRAVSKIASRLDLKHDVLLSIKLQDTETFTKYRTILPFYKNVLREGVNINV